MREPTFLECVFVYENDGYGQPKYKTNKINWNGIKYLLKKLGIVLWKTIKWLLEHIVPAIIAYLLSGA